jgi:predicted dehydrogenase
MRENEMKRGKLGMGLVGPGFIAKHHLDAVRRLGDVEIIGIAGSSAASAHRKVEELYAGRAFRHYEELLADPDVDVVHNTTPSHVHFEITMAAILAGKHVVSDKPLAITPHECAQLRDAAEKIGVVNAVTFNYRGNPLVQQARAMIAGEELGQLVYIHGQYLQDWTTDEDVYSWRMDPEKAGPSSAVADIGSHWIDLAEHVCASRITHVLADLSTVVSTRYSSGHSAEAFGSRGDGERKPVQIHAEDLASVLLRFEDGVRGSLKVSQVLPGHKNDLQLEVNGRTSSLRWKQEEQNELWIGRHDAANSMLCKQPSLLKPAAAAYAHLPAGHQESWADAFRNVIADIYSVIRDSDQQKPATLCTFADAYRTSCVVESMLQSHARGGVWTAVCDPFPNTQNSRSGMQSEAVHRMPAGVPTA